MKLWLRLVRCTLLQPADVNVLDFIEKVTHAICMFSVRVNVEKIDKLRAMIVITIKATTFSNVYYLYNIY